MVTSVALEKRRIEQGVDSDALCNCVYVIFCKYADGLGGRQQCGCYDAIQILRNPSLQSAQVTAMSNDYLTALVAAGAASNTNIRIPRERFCSQIAYIRTAGNTCVTSAISNPVSMTQR